MADAAIQNDTLPATRKKPMFPIGDGLRGYLRTFRRERDIPVTYERLRGFTEAIPLVDADGKPTLWDTVIYDRTAMRALNEALKEVYALIKVDGDKSVVQHLYADRVDFCTFGNSMPFRIRIVNAYNDNQDYVYIKKADASRVYGLELEHLLSPNRLNFITRGNTLVERSEEHTSELQSPMYPLFPYRRSSDLSTSRRPTPRGSTASSSSTCFPPTASTSSRGGTRSWRSTSPGSPGTSSSPAGSSGPS